MAIRLRRGMFEIELADMAAVKQALASGNVSQEDEVWHPLLEKWVRLSELLALPTSPRGPATSPAASGPIAAGTTVTSPSDTVAAARRRQLTWAVSGVAAVVLLVVVGLLAFARGKGTAPAKQPVVQADVPLRVSPQDVEGPVPPPIVAATCGNGIVETGEECDGNAQRPCPAGSGTQACTGTCTWGPCVTTACDGGYFDAGSGLCWQNPPTDRQLDWASATAYCRALDVGEFGPGSWRLPTINELRSLIRGCPATESGGSCGVSDSCCSASCVHPNGDTMTNVSCWAPGCGEAQGGPGAGGAYWPAELRGPDGIYFTSSLCPGCSPQFSRGEPTVWCVIFNRAKVSDYVKTMEASVRCVRRPQDPPPDPPPDVPGGGTEVAREVAPPATSPTLLSAETVMERLHYPERMDPNSNRGECRAGTWSLTRSERGAKAWQATQVRNGPFEGPVWAVVGDPAQVVLMVVRNDDGGSYFQMLCLPFLVWAAGAPESVGEGMLQQIIDAEMSTPQSVRRASGSFAVEVTLSDGAWNFAVLTPTGLQQGM
jgi:hypothetical protein